MTDDEREMPTGPHHEIPDFVAEAPESILGAPSTLNSLLADIREEKQVIVNCLRSMTQLVERSEAAARAIESTLNRILEQNAQIDQLTIDQRSLDMRMTRAEQELSLLRKRAFGPPRVSLWRRLWGLG